jgi:hypothetical protein
LPWDRGPPVTGAVDNDAWHLRAKAISKEWPALSTAPTVFSETFQMNGPRICGRVFADPGKYRQKLAYGRQDRGANITDWVTLYLQIEWNRCRYFHRSVPDEPLGIGPESASRGQRPFPEA